MPLTFRNTPVKVKMRRFAADGARRVLYYEAHSNRTAPRATETLSFANCFKRFWYICTINIKDMGVVQEAQRHPGKIEKPPSDATNLMPPEKPPQKSKISPQKILYPPLISSILL